MYHLLGMVHGHYEQSGQMDIDESTFADVSGQRSINMGIGIVIPASDILSTLNQLELVEDRNRVRERFTLESAKRLPEAD